MEIIKGSKEWIEKVPDEYCIKCLSRKDLPCGYIEMNFTYVKNSNRSVGSGFIQSYGITKVPSYSEGVIIAIHDSSDPPEIYCVDIDNGGVEFRGSLKSCSKDSIIENKHEFSNIYYYSERTLEKQKSYEDSPEWLKEFARKLSASVAYFQF